MGFRVSGMTGRLDALITDEHTNLFYPCDRSFRCLSGDESVFRLLTLTEPNQFKGTNQALVEAWPKCTAYIRLVDRCSANPKLLRATTVRYIVPDRPPTLVLF